MANPIRFYRTSQHFTWHRGHTFRFIISARRMNKTILNRDTAELTRKIYDAQVEMIGVPLNPGNIQNTPNDLYRKDIKNRLAAAAFKYLTNKRSTLKQETMNMKIYKHNQT